MAADHESPRNLGPRNLTGALWAAALTAMLTLGGGVSQGQTPELPDGPGFSVPSFRATPDKHDESYSRLSDVAIGLQPIPERPRLPLELNDLFMSPGFMSKGIELPWGDVVRPSLYVFGLEQFGYQYYDNRQNVKNVSEAVTRLDLFAQLNLTANERIVFGMRPFDKERLNKRVYSSYEFDGGNGINGTNGDIETLFYEGNLADIFPFLDPFNKCWADVGFSVGRQPVLIQDGLLINANRLDAVTVTRNSLNGNGILNWRTTAMYAWDQVHRNNDIYDPSASLLGLFTEMDLKKSTVNVDFVYVNSDSTYGSAFFAAISAVQRLDAFERVWNTSFHALTSVPLDHATAGTGRGTLLFSQISMTPHGTPNLLYFTGFWAIDEFSSAARNPEVGGPLGQVGILFASPAFGQYSTPLSNQATDVAGGAMGYQILLDDTRKQLIFEFGGRKDTNDVHQGAVGLGARYQQAIGRHSILLLDSFITKTENVGGLGAGARAVLQVKF